MIIRLVFFILFWGAAFVVPGGLIAAVTWKVLKPWREKRKLLKSGEKRAKMLVAHEAEKCFECGELVDPAQDVYTARIGWSHTKCYVKIIG